MLSPEDNSIGINKSLIEEFDRFLADKSLSFECIVVGSSPLILMDIISRRTRDCDVLDPKIPQAIKDASIEFAKKKSRPKRKMYEEWFNNGPSSLKDTLPDGWMDRTQVVFEGSSLTIHTLSRLDLIRTKVFAYCDRQVDIDDLLHLNPSGDELAQILEWVKYQDANPDWPEYVEMQVKKLADRLAQSIRDKSGIDNKEK